LLDFFPQDYLSWSIRQHRWMRGDWQIIDWLFPTVPDATNKPTNNPISSVNRWKIFDNLRRALLPIALMIFLISAWLMTPIPVLLTSFAIITIFMPILCHFISSLANPRSIIKTSKELKNGLLRSVVTMALIPHLAAVSLDALCRAFFRK